MDIERSYQERITECWYYIDRAVALRDFRELQRQTIRMNWYIKKNKLPTIEV